MATSTGPGRLGSTTLVQVVAVALLAGGVGVGVASFLPAYLGGASLASQPDLAIGHAVTLAGFALATVLAVLVSPRAAGGPRPLGLPGALGLGVAAVDLGLLITDVGQAASGASAGSGLVLAALSWLLCAAGSVVALHPYLLRPERRAAARDHRDVVGAVALVLAGLAVAGLFAPPWDRYVVVFETTGRTTSFTAGNAFAVPGVMIAGSVVVMVAVAAAALAAALLRQTKVAVTLLAGVLLALAGQIASALVQWRIPLAPSQLGLSPGRAAALGLHVEAGFTVAFYFFCAFVALLATLALARVAFASTARAASAPAAPGDLGPAPGPFAGPAGGWQSAAAMPLPGYAPAPLPANAPASFPANAPASLPPEAPPASYAPDDPAPLPPGPSWAPIAVPEAPPGPPVGTGGDAGGAADRPRRALRSTPHY